MRLDFYCQEFEIPFEYTPCATPNPVFCDFQPVMAKANRNTDVLRINELDDTEFVNAHYRDHRFPCHFHDSFVIQLIHRGIDFCPCNDLSARAGQVFVHFPFAVHSGGNAGSEPLEYQAIYPSVSLIENLTGATLVPAEESSFVSDNPRLVSEVEKLFDLINRKSTTNTRSAMKNVIELICLESASNASYTAGDLRPNSVLLEVRDYLLENFTRDVTNRELSERFLLSEFHLIRRFKRVFGITPRQFLISKRVLESKRLMSNGMSLAHTAISTGFSDQSHLTRQFRRITGYNPGRFVS